jgi:type IV pilus assembly protein PilM
VNQHIQYFTDSEMNVQVVQMNPLAVYNAMHADGRVTETTMVIDLGAETTDLIIADANSIWLRSIPIGGNNFTESLVKAFKLNFQKAEELKRNAASSKYARQIFQAMRPVFADLVAEVQRSIGFYSSVHRESKIGKIVGIGGTFKLPGLQKYLQQNLQLDVERLDSLGAGVPADPKAAATYTDNILSLVSAYGLAVQAMGDGKITSSLLPEHIRRERMWREKTKWFAAAAATFALGTGVGYGSWFVHNVAYESQEGARKEVQQVLTQAKTLDGEWAKVEQAGAADRQRISNVRSLADGRELWATLLPDVILGLPQLPADPVELKQSYPDRKLRQQVVIDSVDADYHADISGPLSATSLASYRGVAKRTGGGGGAAPAQAGGPPANLAEIIAAAVAGSAANASAGARGGGGAAMPLPKPVFAGGSAAASAGGTATADTSQRGFVFILKGTTPYTGGPGAPFQDTVDFLTNGVAKAVAAMKSDKRLDGRRYYIAKAELIDQGPLKANDERIDKLVKQFEAAQAAAKGEVTGETLGFSGGTSGASRGRARSDSAARPSGGGAQSPVPMGPSIDTEAIRRAIADGPDADR